MLTIGLKAIIIKNSKVLWLINLEASPKRKG